MDLGAVQKSLGHSSPEITAAVYDHSSVEDYRIDVERALTFESAAEGYATSMQAAGILKNEAPGVEAFANDSGGFSWSGRQDLNLRPLAPQGIPAPGRTVALHGGLACCAA